ncbi:MAG: hypothetical protein QM813_27480 [Verrucomicrobiota bacterium]
MHKSNASKIPCPNIFKPKSADGCDFVQNAFRLVLAVDQSETELKTSIDSIDQVDRMRAQKAQSTRPQDTGANWFDQGYEPQRLCYRPLTTFAGMFHVCFSKIAIRVECTAVHSWPMSGWD